MAGLQLRIESGDLSRLSRRLSKLLNDVHDLHPVMEDAAQYMVRSTKNRIRKTKTGPNGEKWAAISALTAELKGNDNIMVETGDLADSIQVSDVSRDGFMISTDAEQATWLQNGVRRVKGKYRSNARPPQIPPRPFMGFSDENVRRISKMIRDYLEQGG